MFSKYFGRTWLSRLHRLVSVSYAGAFAVLFLYVSFTNVLPEYTVYNSFTVPTVSVLIVLTTVLMSALLLGASLALDIRLVKRVFGRGLRVTELSPAAAAIIMTTLFGLSTLMTGIMVSDLLISFNDFAIGGAAFTITGGVVTVAVQIVVVVIAWGVSIVYGRGVIKKLKLAGKNKEVNNV
jgi:hypothetical protein